MYLLDTNVLSAVRKLSRFPRLAEWLDSIDTDSMWLSTITMGEVERGIDRLRGHDPIQAVHLTAWRDAILEQHAARILPVTTEIAQRWGVLSNRIGHPSADLLIAATALEHGLTVVTRNVKDLMPTGAALVNPIDGA